MFDGTKVGPYVEWDTPNPQTVYGRSKLAGELELATSDATIVRLSWVCGEHGANMVKTVLRLASDHDELAFVDDQRGHPTFAESVAPLVRRLVGERRPGLFHVTNQGVVSWYEFAPRRLRSRRPRPGRVRPITTAELDPPRPAPRPANSVLDNAALRLEGLPLLPDYRERLAVLVRRHRARDTRPRGPRHRRQLQRRRDDPGLPAGDARRRTGRGPRSRSCSSTTGLGRRLATAERELPQVAIRSDTNLGFAGGANLGLRDLPDDLDYVAIVNSDVTVRTTWLAPSWPRSSGTRRCGAACPKILLADRYEAVELGGRPVARARSTDAR